MHTPDEPFVPLTPAVPLSGSASNLRVAILSAAQLHQPLQPVGHAPAAPAIGPASGCEPRVELQRDGDRVSSIRIECKCGQVIELACLYNSSGPDPVLSATPKSAAAAPAPAPTSSMTAGSVPKPPAPPEPAALPELAGVSTGPPAADSPRPKTPASRSRR